MDRRSLGAILALPANVLGTIPALLLWLTGDWSLAGRGDLRLWLALACGAGGITLMAHTIRRFEREGRGTLAPWHPTQELVVSGIYRRVRNPMISGVVLNLVAEALLFGSFALGVWAATFWGANAVYIPAWEEPGLEARFGEPYRRYKRNVPRWIPRRTPWQP